MKKGYKFYFVDPTSGEIIDALFRDEVDGDSWGKKYSLDYFKHEPHYMSEEIYYSL